MRKQPGQSLTEYGIVLALVTVVAVPSLLMMSDAFYTGIKQAFSSNSGKPKTLQPAGNSASSGSKEGVSTIQMSVTDTSSIDKPTYDPETNKFTYNLPESNGGGAHSTSVEGTVAHKTSIVLLSNLESAAKKLLQEGEISPTQYDSIRNLADKGYRMAEAQKVLENAALQVKDLKTLGNTPVIFEGKTYTFLELSDQVAYFVAPKSAFGAIANDYATQKASVLASIGNPSALQELTELSDNVQAVTNSFATQLRRGALGQYATADEMFKKVSDIASLKELKDYGYTKTDPLLAQSSLAENANSAHQVTVKNSDQICDTGKGIKTSSDCRKF